jgi:hypothetical protein
MQELKFEQGDWQQYFQSILSSHVVPLHRQSDAFSFEMRGARQLLTNEG